MSEQPQLKEITIKTEIINAVMQYLGTRPYQEVAHIINALTSEIQIEIGKQKERRDSYPTPVIEPEPAEEYNE